MPFIYGQTGKSEISFLKKFTVKRACMHVFFVCVYKNSQNSLTIAKVSTLYRYARPLQVAASFFCVTDVDIIYVLYNFFHTLYTHQCIFGKKRKFFENSEQPIFLTCRCDKWPRLFIFIFYFCFVVFTTYEIV